MRIILFIFCIIIFSSCKVRTYNHACQNIHIDRIDKLRFEKDIKPYCTGVFILLGDTVTRLRRTTGHPRGRNSEQICLIEYFNCTDTIVIKYVDIEKRCRPFYRFDNRELDGRYVVSYAANYFYIPMFSFENRITQKPLNGLHKIIYNERKHSIGYFFDGRPLVPLGKSFVREDNGVTRNIEYIGFLQYYIDGEYAYHSIFFSIVHPREHIIKRKGEKVIEIIYDWETRRRLNKTTYQMDGDRLWLKSSRRLSRRKLHNQDRMCQLFVDYPPIRECVRDDTRRSRIRIR